ncbi:MAG: P27 family phage terminase small subunit [Angelakisella sp.]
MAGKAVRKETIKKNTVTAMKKLGTYKAEYEPVIDIYCEMREQYELYTKRLKDDDYKCSEYTATGGTKKSGLTGTIESLRKDILAYSDRLQLNPKALDEKTTQKKGKTSALAKALSNLG